MRAAIRSRGKDYFYPVSVVGDKLWIEFRYTRRRVYFENNGKATVFIGGSTKPVKLRVPVGRREHAKE